VARSGGRSQGSNTFARYWLPVLAYVGVIFYLSAQPHLQSPFGFAQGDKLAHLLEYGGLGVLLHRALRGTTDLGRPASTALVAVTIGMVIGLGDELFQRHVPGRESSAFDFFADTVGLSLAQLVALLFGR